MTKRENYMAHRKTPLVLDYIERVYPCGAIPFGAILSMSEVFGISRQRVHQIVTKAGVARAYGARAQAPRTCQECNEPPEAPFRRYCIEHSKVRLVCAECETEFRIPRSELRSRIAQKERAAKQAAPQFFCSHTCSGKWSGRSFGFATQQRFHHRKTHCIRGHEFTPENTYVYRTGRQCRACHLLRQKEARQRKSLPNPQRTSGTTLTPSSAPAPAPAGSTGVDANTSPGAAQ